MVAIPSRVAERTRCTLTIAARHVLSNAPGVETKPEPPKQPPYIDPPSVIASSPEDDSTKIIAWLDAVHALPHMSTSAVLFERYITSGVAEYAFRLWASAHDFRIEETKTKTSEGTIRALSIWNNWSLVATLHFEPVKWVN